ncbi:MAG: hypothetical protein KDJ98_08200 [Rhodobacteraceae bacterium]|nr:hypothetical protein [Paracoccaceae bacterium]
MRTDQTPLEQVTWSAAERLGEFDRRALADAAEVGYETVSTWVRRWLQRGRIEALGKQGGTTQRYRVLGSTPEAAAARPARQTGPGNMWRTMRGLRSAFTPTDVAAHSTTEAVTVTPADAQVFCQMLVKAGYLRPVRKALPPRREAIYQLIRDTGPRPPRERRVRAVWDENLGEFTHLPEGGEA